MGTQREPVTFTKDTAVRRGLRALAAVLLAASGLAAADLDNDGLDDAWETANGYNTSLYTRIVYVDAVNGDDDAGDGGTAETALRSLGAALARDFAEGDESVVLVAPGTYSGAANRGLDFGGRDIWLRASGGAAQTIIDLEGAGRLLSLTGGETLASRLDGFTVRNGYMASCGIAVHLENASLDIRGCVFEDNRSGRRETYDHGDGQTETWWTDACSTAAIYASGAPVRITGTVFRRNASTETMYGGMGTDSAGALVLADADGSVVEDCLFLGNSGRGAGAVALYGTEAIFRRCRFRRNVSLTGGGGVSASALWDWETGGTDGGSVVLESCLLLGNRAFGDHSDLLVGAGCTATLRHVTASGGTSRGGHAIRLEGDADISDSILDGALSLGEGAVLAADRCCARESLAAHGDGNLVGDPALTGAGLLTTASVCRGAGGADGLPPTDIDGNAWGAAADIGCRAFTDTDGDGIPDDVEAAAGTDPADPADAAGDRDGDGIPNLREYELGTGIATADGDGDGVADAAELALGQDPTWPTRVLHVSASGDDGADGLTPETPMASLAAAVEASRGCGWENVIRLAPGTYSGEGFRGLDFGGFDIAVRGDGPASAVVIDLEGAGRLLSASGCETAASRLEGLTIRNGAADRGAAVLVSGASLTLRGCVIEGCSATWRGALCVSDSGLLVAEGCSLRGNTAWVGAAISVQSSATLLLSGSELRGNRASSDGGGLHLDGASAELSGCRLLFCRADGRGGGAMLSGTSELSMANCLLLGCGAGEGGSDLHGDSPGQTVSLTNCTLAPGPMPKRLSCSLDGQVSLLNSIFTGDVSLSGSLPSASFNCAPADWSGLGSGNISSDPLLTGMGMLRPGSPCVDAGTDAGAPAADLFGNARPAGGGVDIGCHELLDADADGIPDFLEGGADLLPDGDADGDGLTNLQECLLGTDLLAPDTDGDGIGDATEATLDYCPLLPTRIVHVNPVTGDDAASGLSASAAKRTLSAAVAAAGRVGHENVVLAAPGTYSGAPNRGLDFGGHDIKLISAAGAARTVIDLEGAGRLLSLTGGETLASRLDGFTVRNGYMASCGIAVHLENASLDIRGCVFENNRSGRRETYDHGDGQTETWWTDGLSTAAVHASGAPVRITGTVFRNNASRGTMWGGSGPAGAGAVLLRRSEGSVIDGCDFIANRGQGAGAIAVSGATLDITRSRFLHNLSHTDGGAVSASPDWYGYDGYGEAPPATSVSLTNCLLLDNRAVRDFSDLNFGDGCSAILLNDTLAGGSARDGHSSRFGGGAAVANSVVQGCVALADGIAFTALSNCTPNDWSAHGTGNIASDPMLTGMGMLKADSPCIDAGTSSNAPATDLFGNARPAGNAVDIGCQEFLDTDSDGLPDFLEGNTDILPNGDEDNDGLSNLQEYNLGTGIFTADTDGDGISDGTEIQQGRDPLLPANIIYISPLGDDTANGRTAATAKATFAAALELLRECGSENIVIAAPGSYTGAGNRSLDFEGFDVSIMGAEGATPTVIDLENAGRFLSLTGGEGPRTRLVRLAFRNGAAERGSVIYSCGSAPYVGDCSFVGNAAPRGGAVCLEGREGAVLERCVFDGNRGASVPDGDDGYGMYGEDGGAAVLVGAGGGVTVLDCAFRGNEVAGDGGAVRVSGGRADFARTRFAFNLARRDGGAVRLEGAAAATFSDCLFRGNRSLGQASAIYGGNAGQSCTIVNCTLMDGGSSDGLACRLEGNAILRNTVLTEGIGFSQERPPTVAWCAVPTASLAALGTGNITSDPQLTGAGMLKTGSPCVDAGTAAGAPAADLFGNARPAGGGVDIGCHEFIDSDGDGIPDFLEGGGDLLPDGDEDGDGLTNLQECLLGTDLRAPDTDGDGIGDATEATLDYCPLLPTRIVHVNPVTGDDAASGLSASAAKRTLSAAVAAAGRVGHENVVLAAPGTYSGAPNRGLDFGGHDIKLISAAGAARTVVDLEGAGRLLSLTRHETLASRLDGFTVRNGYMASCGIAVHLENASLDIRDCVFENNNSGRKVTYDYGDGHVETWWEDASSTAAVHASGAPVRITGTVFRNNASRGTMWGGSGPAGAGAVLLRRSEGSVIDGCDFIANRGQGAGAIAVSGATLDITRSRFLHNLSHTDGGAVSASPDWYGYDGYGEAPPATSVSLTNCLLLGNRAVRDFSDLNFGDGCSAILLNDTLAGGSARDGHSARFGGDAAVANSVVQGCVSLADGIAFTALSNCTPNDWSAHGTGNISSDPLLTGMGMLRAGSPCIDAGTAAGAPAADLFGNARPAGSGVDIGCHELLDADADGIPDFREGGADLLPDGDADGDGLTNLREYLLGTDLLASDTDGDGISDGTEIQQGRDPLLPANIIYISPLGDDTANGRTAATAKATFAAALELLRECEGENIVIAASGTYSGAGNRELDFEGFDVSILGASGASPTVIDLENAGRFLSLTGGEGPRTRLVRLAFRNGAAERGSVIYSCGSAPYVGDCSFVGNAAPCGGAVCLEGREGAVLERCVFDGNRGASVPDGDDGYGMFGEDGGAAVLVGEGGGVTVLDCAFRGNEVAGGGGAVRVSGGRADFARTRFAFNLARRDGGAVRLEGAAAATFSDCLFRGNRSLGQASAIRGDGAGQSCSLVNCTLMDGGSSDGLACRFEGNATFRNTILTEGIGFSQERPPTVACCAVPTATLAALGTGNITADPMLTGYGLLMAGSPCIDAGTTTGALPNDLFSNARPAGNGVDIGCHEFLDSDDDGIPDFLEGNSVLPGDDADNDGLSNLQEYLLGTDIFTSDTDADGVADGIELSLGRDPLRPTRIVHVSPLGDDAASGLSASAAKRTLAAAVAAARTAGWENLVLAAPGTYAGDGNRGLDFHGYDIRVVSAGGPGAAMVDLAGDCAFLALRRSETYRSCLEGLAFVRSGEAAPAVTLEGAALTVSGCSFRGFARTGSSDDYMFYDYDFSVACVLRLRNAGCRLERVEVSRCAYSPDCPLLSCDGSTLSLDRCRIVGNETGCGPLFRLRGSAMDMVNTMVARNNVSSAGGIALLHGDSRLKSVNCTFSANAASAAAAISGDGEVEMLNTVFGGLVSGCGVSLSHCVVAPAYADAASGCVTGGAGLVGDLFLTPESPCIDAGASEGAPAIDFAGTPRPQGAGVDIGCEEHRDSDGDGISDFYSEWCGGGLGAGGDQDGDGLSDLQEMLLGTDARNPDTDGDGMPDGWEASHGLDPLRADEAGDADGDGLVNIDELAMGTDPMDPDSDGDGQGDGWEAHTAFSDPTVADFSGTPSAVVSLTGNLFTDSGGGWEADGDGARARGRSGWLQYSVQVPADGVYLLEVGVSEAGGVPTGSFTISCAVDGASCGSLLRVPLDAARTGTGVCMTPFLRAGPHTVRIDWDNVYRSTSLRVDSIRLLAPGGPDADGDGVPDWAETRLANMSCTALPQRSRVSPLCVEGGNASYIEAIAVSGYYVAPGGDDPHPPVRRIAGNRWCADLPLDPDGVTPVSVTVSYQNSAATVSGNVLWEAVDAASLDGDTVRLDDEMLLGAELPEGVQAWTLAIGGDSWPMARGEVRRHRFAEAGEVTVRASWTENGEETVNEAVVHVLSASMGGEQICHAGTERIWRIAGVGDGIHVEIDRDVQATDLGCSGGARQLLLRGVTPAVAYATARVRDGGPVLDTTAVHVIETATHLGDGYHRVIADFGDGTVLYDGYVVAGQVVEGMSVTVTLWGTNSTFEDGTQEKTFTWESFDASGELHFSILGGRSFTTCMTVILCQDGEEVWRLQ